MALGDFGKIAISEIVFYIPVLCIALFIALKRGFNKQQGFIFIFMFSLVRIIGACLSIASRTTSNPSTGLIVASAALQGAGLSPLLLATLGFVIKIAHYGLPSYNSRVLHLGGLTLTGAVVLGIIGGVKASPGNAPSTVDTGHTLSRVGGVLYVVAYVCLFGLHVLLWRARERIPTHHRTLLLGVSLALPSLFVRIIYSLGSAFASSFQSRWSPVSGDWRIFLVMGVIMEYLVVFTYVLVGATTPLHKDDEVQKGGAGPYRASQDALLEMGKRSKPYAYAPAASSFVNV